MFCPELQSSTTPYLFHRNRLGVVEEILWVPLLLHLHQIALAFAEVVKEIQL
jgi:hypothetical protein